MRTLTIRRDKGWADRLRSYQIFVDDADIGLLAPGSELQVEVDDGSHSIYAKIDWCSSRQLEIEPSSRDRTVTIRNALRGSRLLLALPYILFNRRGYLVAEVA